MFGVLRFVVATVAGAVLADLVYVAAFGVYSILLVSYPRGQTVGNLATSTRVVDAATAQPPPRNRAAVRWAVQLVLNITFVGGILDVLWPLWDPRNQTLHDKAAGTLMVTTA